MSRWRWALIGVAVAVIQCLGSASAQAVVIGGMDDDGQWYLASVSQAGSLTTVASASFTTVQVGADYVDGDAVVSVWGFRRFGVAIVNAPTVPDSRTAMAFVGSFSVVKSLSEE